MLNNQIIGKFFWVVAILGLVFQIAHFSEHLLQAGAWIAGFRQVPYMTPWGMWCVERFGEWFFPNANMTRQMKLGMELLHVIGNGIFFIGIAALLVFVRTKKVVWAFWIEAFHLYEHISLTLTAYFINKSIGMSTLWGMQADPVFLVAFRVWWHFVLNLIPSLFVLFALWERRRRKKTGGSL